MSYERYTNYFVALKVNGKVASDLAALILDFTFEDNFSKVDKCSITFSDPAFKLADDPRLFADTQWRFIFGYPGDMSRERHAVLKFYTPAFGADGMGSVTVQLHGKGESLVRAKGGKNWGNVQSSEVARRIAKKHNLKFLGENSEDQQEAGYVQASGTSDYHYLSQLAADIGFEFFVDNTTLFYRARDTAYADAPRMRLFYGYGVTSPLLSFSPEVKATSPTHVEAKSSDTKTGATNAPAIDSKNVGGVHLGDLKGIDKDIFENRQKVTSGHEAAQVFNAVSGKSRTELTLMQERRQVWDSNTGKALGDTVHPSVQVVTTPETNKKKVEKLAKAHKRHFLDASVQASCEVIGTPAMHAKANFEFILPNKRLSGPWYCKEAKHSISAGGYTTTAKLKRGAFTEKRKKTKKPEAATAKQQGRERWHTNTSYQRGDNLTTFDANTGKATSGLPAVPTGPAYTARRLRGPHDVTYAPPPTVPSK